MVLHKMVALRGNWPPHTVMNEDKLNGTEGYSTILDFLPHEIWQHILSFLELFDLFPAEQVCTLFYRLINGLPATTEPIVENGKDCRSTNSAKTGFFKEKTLWTEAITRDGFEPFRYIPLPGFDPQLLKGLDNGKSVNGKLVFKEAKEGIPTLPEPFLNYLDSLKETGSGILYEDCKNKYVGMWDADGRFTIYPPNSRKLLGYGLLPVTFPINDYFKATPLYQFIDTNNDLPPAPIGLFDSSEVVKRTPVLKQQFLRFILQEGSVFRRRSHTLTQDQESVIRPFNSQYACALAPNGCFTIYRMRDWTAVESFTLPEEFPTKSFSFFPCAGAVYPTGTKIIGYDLESMAIYDFSSKTICGYHHFEEDAITALCPTPGGAIFLGTPSGQIMRWDPPYTTADAESCAPVIVYAHRLQSGQTVGEFSSTLANIKELFLSGYADFKIAKIISHNGVIISMDNHGGVWQYDLVSKEYRMVRPVQQYSFEKVDGVAIPDSDPAGFCFLFKYALSKNSTKTAESHMVIYKTDTPDSWLLSDINGLLGYDADRSAPLTISGKYETEKYWKSRKNEEIVVTQYLMTPGSSITDICEQKGKLLTPEVMNVELMFMNRYKMTLFVQLATHVKVIEVIDTPRKKITNAIE